MFAFTSKKIKILEIIEKYSTIELCMQVIKACGCVGLWGAIREAAVSEL